MKKKSIITITILILILSIIIITKNIYSIYQEKKTSEDHLIQKTNLPNKTKLEEENQFNNQRMIKVDGKLYYDSGQESKIKARCGVMDGKITSHTDLIPTEDNQANFSGEYSYQFSEFGTIDVVIDGKWQTFKPLNQTIDFLDNHFKIEIVKDNSQDITKTTYYQKADNKTIYLVGIAEIYLIDSHHKVTLKEYIEKEKITSDIAITYIECKIKHVSSLDDEVSIYLDEGNAASSSNENKVSNMGFKLIECHTQENNTDVYIGLENFNESIAFKKGFCLQN